MVHLHAVAAPGERGREVEAEAVHAHLGDPVAQRVGDQPDGVRLAGVQGVAAAGVVGVAATAAVQPVVAGVVDPAQAQCGPVDAALGGVVVDHVEDHLDARRVQRPDHPLELADLLPPRPGGRVAAVRREEAEAVVPPVVGHAAPLEVVLADELMDRQQLDGRHPEAGQVRDGRRVGEARVGAAQLGRDAGVAHGEALDVQLVQHRLGPRGLRAVVVVPVVVVVHDHGLGHVRRGVPVVPDGVGDVALGPVADGGADRVVGRVVAVHRAGVRVEQQLGRVPAGTRPRVPPAVHPVAVAGAGQDAGQEAVPGLEGLLAERVSGLVARLVEQAELHGLGVGRPEREVGAPGAVRVGAVAGAQRLPTAGPGGGGRRTLPDRRASAHVLLQLLPRRHRPHPSSAGGPFPHLPVLPCSDAAVT